jgi:SAM-dependent methyltransferase
MTFNRATSSERAYDEYYASLSKYATSFTPSAEAAQFEKAGSIFVRFFPDRCLSILDVGCWSGGFLAKLREFGYVNLAALDPSPACVEVVGLELGVVAKVGTLPYPPYEAASFDVVVSRGVFEHLLNPLADLAYLRRLLRPGGDAFIAVPDAAMYIKFLDAPFHDFNIEHLNHFSSSLLERLVVTNGWKKIEVVQDRLVLTPKWTDTAIFGVFNVGGSVSENYDIKYDAQFVSNIKSYISESYKLLAKINENLIKDLSGETEGILWGADQTTSILLGQTVLANLKYGP